MRQLLPVVAAQKNPRPSQTGALIIGVNSRALRWAVTAPTRKSGASLKYQAALGRDHTLDLH